MRDKFSRKAIIIGAGLGLQQLGHHVLIFERTPEIHRVGAGLSIWKNGLTALQALGVDDAFLQSGLSDMMETTVRAANGDILSQGVAKMRGHTVTDLVRVSIGPICNRRYSMPWVTKISILAENASVSNRTPAA